MNKKLVIVCFIYVLIISAAFWIITPIGIDFETNALRIGELAAELARPNGGFPVYIYRNLYNHYGYPIPIFYGSISLLPFALFVRMGMGVLTAYKLMILTVFWMSFCSAYLCLGSFIRERITVFLGAFLYMIQPFFLTEIFVRSANSGGLVFVFIPLVITGYLKITADDPDYRRGIMLLAVGMSGVITSHVTSTVLVTIALFVLFLIQLPNMSCRLCKTLMIVLAAILCFALTAWYLMPMLEQMIGGNFVGSSVHELMIPNENLFGLLIPMHLSLALSSIMKADLPLSMIGGTVLTMCATVIWLAIRGRGEHAKAAPGSDGAVPEKTEKLLGCTYFFIVFLLLFHWTIVEQRIAFIQFAWRIFLIASVAESVLNVILIHRLRSKAFNRFRLIAGMAVGIYVIVFFFGYHAIKNTVPALIGSIGGRDVSTYEYAYESYTADDLYLPTCVDKEYVYENEREVTATTADGIDCSDMVEYQIDEARGTVSFGFGEEALTEDVTVTCPFIMYKGYSAVNTGSGERFDMEMNGEGMANVIIPAGSKGECVVSYTGTTVQRASYVISLVAGLGCLTCCGTFGFKHAIKVK